MSNKPELHPRPGLSDNLSNAVEEKREEAEAVSEAGKVKELPEVAQRQVYRPGPLTLRSSTRSRNGEGSRENGGGIERRGSCFNPAAQGHGKKPGSERVWGRESDPDAAPSFSPREAMTSPKSVSR